MTMNENYSNPTDDFDGDDDEEANPSHVIAYQTQVGDDAVSPVGGDDNE
jgi:hypothetical protein